MINFALFGIPLILNLYFIVGTDESRDYFVDGSFTRVVTICYAFAQSFSLAALIAFGGYSYQYMDLKNFNNLL